MTQSKTAPTASANSVSPINEEPRWPAVLAVLAIAALRLTLSESLSLGPRWLLFVVVGILLVPLVWTRYRGSHDVNQVIGYVLNSVITADMAWSLWLLIDALPSHKLSPGNLLRSAAALWISNILVFAAWYWRLDGGGPRARAMQGPHKDGAFLFPQMTLSPELRKQMGEDFWSPNFVDYLFLSFNTSTAFSPTDSPVLSRWAKALMMVQALISFATVALLAARAVNIL